MKKILPLLFISLFLTGCGEINTWKISYESDYGIVPDAKEVRDNYVLTENDIPELKESGYVFKVWIYKGTNSVAAAGDIIMVHIFQILLTMYIEAESFIMNLILMDYMFMIQK